MQKKMDLKFKIRSDFKYLPFLTRLSRLFRKGEGGRLAQILVEAYNNAVCHAHRRHAEKWIALEIRHTPKQTILRVGDQGPGIPKKFFARKSGDWETHGRGLALICAKADRVQSIRTKKGHCLEATCYYGLKRT